MAEGDFLKAKVRVSRQFYPKGKKVESGDYAILSVEVLETIEGEAKVNENWGTISIKGIVCAWEYKEVYTLIAKEGETNNFGTSYEIVSFFKEMDLSTINNQKLFLGKILTEIQVNNLYATLDNPLQAIMEHNIDLLCSVKGIGATTAQKIIEKYEDHKDYSEAYIALDKLGLTNKMIQKLCKHYGNPTILVQKIQDNPYIVADEVNGIGWAKADEIAMNSGIGKTSQKRIVAYIKFVLEKQANTYGDSYVYSEDLFDYINNTLGEDITDEMIGSALRQLMEKKEIWSDENRETIALMKYRRLEFNIAKDLVRLNEGENLFNTTGWRDIVTRLEKDQGWCYGKEQMEGIEATLKNNVVLITGYGGCVDCDTEYFNGTEWKRIADYSGGDKVLQYNEDGTTELVIPLEYLHKKCEYLWELKDKSQCLSSDHELLYLNKEGELDSILVEDFLEGILDNSVTLLTQGELKQISPKDFILYKTKDNSEYCFVVPSHMLILRRNNIIFVTKNCGKTSIVSAMNKVLKNYPTAQCALSGRASVNLTLATGMEGETIHRLLAYNPVDGYGYNKNNKLFYDVIILDEVSLVDANLFYHLIQAIKTGSKLIMLGDYGQLESIGVGNILMDLIRCGKITHINLTEIHRQAKKSAIALDSIEVWNGRQVIEEGFVGKELRGELQDLLYDITDESNTTADRIMRYYKDLYNKIDDIMELQVIVPLKNRGECCTYKLNNRIQRFIRDTEGLSDNDEHIIIGEDEKSQYKLYVGDKVMNTRNNYNTREYIDDYNYEEDNHKFVPIMNGNQGIIKKIIDDETLVIDFERLGEVLIHKDWFSYIELAYATTVHKYQGSQVKCLICGLDYSHYVMLSKEMLYTMMTRARKYCVIVGENKAIRYACSQSGVIEKKTFLCNLLKFSYDRFIEILKEEEKKKAEQVIKKATAWFENELDEYERQDFIEEFKKEGLNEEERLAKIVEEYSKFYY